MNRWTDTTRTCIIDGKEKEQYPSHARELPNSLRKISTLLATENKDLDNTKTEELKTMTKDSSELIANEKQLREMRNKEKAKIGRINIKGIKILI